MTGTVLLEPIKPLQPPSLLQFSCWTHRAERNLEPESLCWNYVTEIPKRKRSCRLRPSVSSSQMKSSAPPSRPCHRLTAAVSDSHKYHTLFLLYIEMEVGTAIFWFLFHPSLSEHSQSSQGLSWRRENVSHPLRRLNLSSQPGKKKLFLWKWHLHFCWVCSGALPPHNKIRWVLEISILLRPEMYLWTYTRPYPRLLGEKGRSRGKKKKQQKKK